MSKDENKPIVATISFDAAQLIQETGRKKKKDYVLSCMKFWHYEQMNQKEFKLLNHEILIKLDI